MAVSVAGTKSSAGGSHQPKQPYAKTREKKTATPVEDGAKAVGEGFPVRLAVTELTVSVIVVGPGQVTNVIIDWK